MYLINVKMKTLLILLSLLICLAEISPAYARKSNEAKLKAAFIFNVLRMVRWPSQVLPSGAPILMCLVGEDILGKPLNKLEKQKIKSHRIKIQRSVTLDDMESCHVLFINARDANLKEVLPIIAGRAILTIGDVPRFAHNGGMVNLEKISDRIRVEINLDAVKATDLKIRSRLLSLAEIVEEE